WTDGVGYVQTPSAPPGATEVIRRFLGVRGITGRIYVNVRLDDGRLAANFYDPATRKWGGDVWVPVMGPDGKPAMVKDLATASNNPVQSALFAIGNDDEVLFSEDSFRTSRLRKLGRKASHLAVVTDAADLLCVFAVERDTGMLWLKRQRKHSTGGGIQFEDWVRVDPSQDARLSRVHANLRLDGRVEVFALDEGGDLRYTRQALGAGGRVEGWSVLFPLHAGAGDALFATGRTQTGYSEAYSVTRDARIYRFWQSPQSEQWFTDPVEVASPDLALASVPTHAAEITVVDDRGLPVAGADVLVNASFLTTLWIDGSAYRVSLVDPVRLKTGPTGRLVLHQRATALAAATLLVQTSSTPAGAPISVQPNAQLQAKLAALDARQVLDARDASGRPLLPLDAKDRERTAESIAQISQRSMQINQAGAEAVGAVQYRFTSPRHAGFTHRLDLAALNETAWEIDFSGGYPQYRDTTVAQVQAYRSERLVMLQAASPQAAAGSAEAAGFLGVDWGAVWNAIRSGVEWAIDGLTRIVVTIVNGIATVLFEIAGKIFEAVLEVVQQAFDFIEGVWNWLKVKLQQLYEWLAFLFNPADFARTAEGVKHTVGVVLDFGADAVHALRGQVEQGFDNLKANLESVTDRLVRQLNGQGDPGVGGYFEEHQATDEQSNTNDHNIFFNALQENQGAIRVTGGGAVALSRSAALDDPISGVLERMRELSNNFEFGDGKKAFDEAFAYFDNVGSDPGRALDLVLSGLVKVFEGVALFAIDVAKGVVLTLFDLVEDLLRMFREALFAEWEIPVVSQLYKLFTGESLSITPVDVAAWVVAIPSTLLSKVVLNRSPYPDDAALQRFKEGFTVEMLRRRTGIGAATRDAAPAQGGAEVSLALGDGYDRAWKENFLTGYAAAMFVRTLAEPGQIILHAGGKGLGDAAIVPVVLRLMTTGFTAPWALSPRAAGPSCTPGEPGFGVTIWILQLLLGPMRGGLIVKQTLIKDEAKIYTGELTVTLWGVANLVMTAWNFGAGPQEKGDKLAFSRAMTNLIPGQTLRFLAVPGLNKETYFIPAGILVALTIVGYLGSFGVAIAEIHTD
ncbi:MAG TPA: hypothetical protein VEQ60_31030, partial [Longimicrobium sp.]|nr:hypothetical protein [Longimicrobium sp.]